MKINDDTPAEIPVLITDQEPVELYKILKITNWVGSGGEAKYVIAEGQVFVNQVVETRKRKKISFGDVVEFEGNKIRLGKPKS